MIDGRCLRFVFTPSYTPPMTPSAASPQKERTRASRVRFLGVVREP
jgi:hypothetical protein